MRQGRDKLVTDNVLADAAKKMGIENFHILSHDGYGKITILYEGQQLKNEGFTEFKENHNYVIHEASHYISVKCIDANTLEIQDSLGTCVKKNPTTEYQEKDNCRDKINSIFQKIFGDKLNEIFEGSKNQVGFINSFLENPDIENFSEFLSDKSRIAVDTEKTKMYNKKYMEEIRKKNTTEVEQKNILQHEAFKGKTITVKTPIFEDKNNLTKRLIGYFKEEDTVIPQLMGQDFIVQGKETLNIESIDSQATNACADNCLAHLRGTNLVQATKKINECADNSPAHLAGKKGLKIANNTIHESEKEQDTMSEEKKDISMATKSSNSVSNNSFLGLYLFGSIDCQNPLPMTAKFTLGSINKGGKKALQFCKSAPGKLYSIFEECNPISSFYKGNEITFTPDEDYEYSYNNCNSNFNKVKHPFTKRKMLTISDKSQITVANQSGKDKSEFLNHIADLSNITAMNHIHLDFNIDEKEKKDLINKIDKGRSVRITYLDKQNQEKTIDIEGNKQGVRLTQENINTSQNTGQGPRK